MNKHESLILLKCLQCLDTRWRKGMKSTQRADLTLPNNAANRKFVKDVICQYFAKGELRDMQLKALKATKPKEPLKIGRLWVAGYLEILVAEAVGDEYYWKNYNWKLE